MKAGFQGHYELSKRPLMAQPGAEGERILQMCRTFAGRHQRVRQAGENPRCEDLQGSR